jgi:hypothetical protein
LAGIAFIIAVPTILLKSPPPLPHNHNQEVELDTKTKNKLDVNLENGDIDTEELSKELSETPLKTSKNAKITEKQRKFRYYAIIVLVSSYLFLYVGAEASFGGWIFSYAVEVYDFSRSEGAYLSSAFWGSLTLFRLVAVPVSMWLTPHAMLMTDMGVCLVSLLSMILFVSWKSKVFLWIMTVAFGAGMASVYATAFSLPQTLKVNMTSKAASLLVVGVSIGDMVLPMFVGWMMRLFGAGALLWTALVMFLVAVVIYLILVYGMNYVFCWWCRNDVSQYSIVDNDDGEDSDESLRNSSDICNNNNNKKKSESVSEEEEERWRLTTATNEVE